MFRGSGNLQKQPRDIRQHQNTRNFIKFEKPACHYNHGDEQHHKQNERRKAKIKREKQRRPEHIQNELNEVNAERTRRLPADIRIVSAPNFFPLRSCLPTIYILAADIPIKTNKIVHTTGKSHDGGASGGCLSAPYSFMADIAKTEDIPPAASAAAIETMYTNVLLIFFDFIKDSFQPFYLHSQLHSENSGRLGFAAAFAHSGAASISII